MAKPKVSRFKEKRDYRNLSVISTESYVKAFFRRHPFFKPTTYRIGDRTFVA